MTTAAEERKQERIAKLLADNAAIAAKIDQHDEEVDALFAERNRSWAAGMKLGIHPRVLAAPYRMSAQSVWLQVGKLNRGEVSKARSMAYNGLKSGGKSNGKR